MDGFAGRGDVLYQSGAGPALTCNFFNAVAAGSGELYGTEGTDQQRHRRGRSPAGSRYGVAGMQWHRFAGSGGEVSIYHRCVHPRRPSCAYRGFTAGPRHCALSTGVRERGPAACGLAVVASTLGQGRSGCACGVTAVSPMTICAHRSANRYLLAQTQRGAVRCAHDIDLAYRCCGDVVMAWQPDGLTREM